MAKRMLEYSGVELRTQAKSRKKDEKQPALAELARRRDNLRGAVIPAWEFAERGDNVDEWELV